MTGRFAALLELVSADRRVLGVILGGSIRKGFETEHSNWDVTVVIEDGADAGEMERALSGVDSRWDAWELEHHPLDPGRWLLPDPVETLLQIHSAGDSSAQSAVFGGVERQARLLGLGDVLDAWGDPALAVMRR